jgi:hypothetical protein
LVRRWLGVIAAAPLPFLGPWPALRYGAGCPRTALAMSEITCPERARRGGDTPVSTGPHGARRGTAPDRVFPGQGPFSAEWRVLVRTNVG